MKGSVRWTGGQALSPGHESLALGVPPSAPGTIHALALTGGITIKPKEGREILFGRNRPDVHVCIGENDRQISRQHGVLTHHRDHWWVRNTGQVPIRLPGSRLLLTDEDPIPLNTGYTPVFVRGSRGREHLLELYVTGPLGQQPSPQPGEATQPPRTWRLSERERLVLVTLGQRYLLHEAYPQPLAYQQAANQLAMLQPEAGWTPKRVENVVSPIRTRLSRGGVAGLTRDEVGEPVGNTLNHNLIRELLESTTLLPPDLCVLNLPED